MGATTVPRYESPTAPNRSIATVGQITDMRSGAGHQSLTPAPDAGAGQQCGGRAGTTARPHTASRIGYGCSKLGRSARVCVAACDAVRDVKIARMMPWLSATEHTPTGIFVPSSERLPDAHSMRPPIEPASYFFGAPRSASELLAMPANTPASA